MSKWIPLLLCLFLVHNVAVDSFDLDCQKSASHGTSCAVPCHNHMVPPSTGLAVMPTDAPSSHDPVSEPLFVQRLFDKSLFRPPKASA